MKLLPFFLALSDALDCENLADSENFKTITNSKIAKKCKNQESSKCDVMCSKGFQLSTYDKKSKQAVNVNKARFRILKFKFFFKNFPESTTFKNL